MGITVKDVARDSGISLGTVDRVLHGRSGVKPATRARVLESIRKLGYKPDMLARGLVKGRSSTIGLVTMNLGNSFVTEFISSAEARARRDGYFTYITNSDMKAEGEEDCINHLIQRRVDGIILQSVHPRRGYAAWLKRQVVPIVSVGNRISPAIPFIGIDDRAAGRDAVRHMRARGYGVLIIIAPPLAYVDTANVDAQEQRYRGFLDAVQAEGDAVEHFAVTSKDFSPVIARLRERRKRKTAVFCTSDITALKLLNVLRENGFAAPDHVGLMGFDNIATLQYVWPRICTIDQNVSEIAARAVESLFTLIDGRRCPPMQVLPHTFIEGESL